MACCGHVAFLIAELVPIFIATAVGGATGRFTGSKRAGPWIAAGLAAAINVGLAGALYYYSTHHVGGPPEPELDFQQFAGFSVMGSLIGGATSYFLCRALR